MKIAYILTTYPCPSETFIQREITQLKEKGFEITVFASEGKAGESVRIQDLPVYYRPSLFSPSAVWSIIFTTLRHPVRLVKLTVLMVRLLVICSKEAETILVNFHTICFFAKTSKKQYSQHIHACFLSWPACIGLGVSTLTELSFSISAHARDIFVEGGAVGLKAKKARFISCCTRQGLECLKNNIDNAYHNRLFLNYHGIELNQPCNNFNCHEKDSSEFIIAVGRLVEKKGFEYLIEAFAKVVQKWPNISLVIVGDGPRKKHLKSMIEKSGLASKVQLAGWLDHSCVLKLIGQAEILIVPSVIDADGDRDGLPNVILEAYSVGTSVIASNLAGISEAVINEKTGLLVKPGDKIELADAIDRLLTDKNLAAILTENARKMLTDNFNIIKNSLKLAEAFKKGRCPDTEKIKIAHITEGFVGGMSTYLCNVLVTLKEAGFDVTLIYSPERHDIGSPAKIDRLKKHGIKIHAVPMTRAINPVIDLYCLFILTKILIKERFDIIHTHCSKAGALGRIAVKLVGIKKIYHSSHCFAFLRCGNFLTKEIYLFIEKFLAGFTTKFIAVSDSDAKSAKNWRVFDEGKCVIVNNGLPVKSASQKKICETVSKIRQSFNLPLESFVVATACRLVEYKGLFTFLKAAKLSKSNAVFVIAGDGPLKTKIEKHIFANSLSEKVKLLGHICDMDRLYSICDLVVLCSQMEAQPFLLLEAMRANCTVIASDVAGNRELLAGDRGLLVEPEPGRLAKAVDYLLSDSQKRFQLAQNAYRYLASRHRLEDQVQKLACIYLDKVYTKERICNIADYRTERICSEKY
ncbi:MAG: glycosyltransferase family 4 protein [Planctomycetota bacterium]|jgi:glycosyltransferase involved in cell wall biosynthesis